MNISILNHLIMNLFSVYLIIPKLINHQFCHIYIKNLKNFNFCYFILIVMKKYEFIS